MLAPCDPKASRFSPHHPHWSIVRGSSGVERAYPLKVSGRVDARRGGTRRDFHDDPVSVPEGPQLLERFEAFNGRARQRRIACEKIDAIRVKPVMAVERKRGRQCAHWQCKRFARPGNRRTTEVKRVVAMIERHF